jgi:hypothetical protein
MVRCTIVHTSGWWKWTFPCVMSWLLIVVTYHWSSTSSKTSSGSSSTSIACSISSRRVILRCLIMLRGIVLRLCRVVPRLHVIIWLLHSVILMLRSVVWSWNLIKLWRCLPSHHFSLHSICVGYPFSHQFYSFEVFVIVAHRLAKGAI